MAFIEKVCKLSGVVWKQYNSLQKCQCEECLKVNPPKPFVSKFKPNLKLKSFKPIAKVSKKKAIQDAQYYVLRTEFLVKKENQICPITGQQTTEVHHKWSGKDRAKYYLDVSTWLAVSRDGHIWIHQNSKEAREKGFLF